MASEQPFVCRINIHDGRASYVILLDDRYWHASDWEMKMVMEECHHPEDLGMIPSDNEEE